MSQQPLPIYRPRKYLSLSTLMSFARCPRKYFYEKCGLTQPDEPTALHYGTAMHRAVSIALTSGLDAAMSAFESVWDDSLADPKRSLSRARAQLSHYVHTHTNGRSIYNLMSAPPSDVKLDDDVSPYEIPFAIDIGLPVPLCGRLDGWAEHRDTKDAWGFEFKTASRVSAAMFDGLELNPQVLTYALVTRTITGRKIRGIMFEAMLIDASKVDNVTHPVVVQDHLLDDVLIWLRYQGSLLLACEARLAECENDASRAFPKNFAGCSAYPQFYMPGSHCDFENLCRVSRWQDMAQYYAIRPEHSMVDLSVEGVKPTPVEQTNAT